MKFLILVCSLLIISQPSFAQLLGQPLPLPTPENVKSQLDQPEPLLIEGVYEVEGVLQVTDGSEKENLDLNITIMQSVRTGNMNLTVSSRKFRNVLFFASQVLYQRSKSDIVEVESFGVNFRGGRQHMVFRVDPNKGTIEGTISANFIEQEEPFQLVGKKIDSTFEKYQEDSLRSCSNPEKYRGRFEGHFINDEATLFIHDVPAGNGEIILTASVVTVSKHLFHDGFYSAANKSFSFGNDIAYPMRGLSKKLILFCDEDDKNYILRGLHIASTGVIVRNIEFKKPK